MGSDGGAVHARRVFVSLVALVIAAAGGQASSAAGQALRYDLRTELGGEYDDNAHRTEIVDGAENQPRVVGSPVVRAAVAGRLSDAVARGQQLALSATLAGKLFTAPAARSEDVAIAESSARWRVAMSALTGIALQAQYYEAFQRAGDGAAAAAERRDFRSLTPALHFDLRAVDSTVLVAGAGYRWFVFKSDRGFDFEAPSASLDVRWMHEPPGDQEGDGDGADWELTAGGSLERRAFAGRALVAASNTAPTAPPPQRADTFLVAHLELTRVGGFLAGAGYALHVNDSNSYGESLTRHVATLRLATPLPLHCYLAARAELIFAHYREPVAIGRVSTTGRLLSIDDENRSSLRVDLSRALTQRWLLLARYTIYANEIGVSSAVARYRRQTALLSVAFTFEK
ncbi:MAG TPA: hypothetical protein VFH68_19375 [Polyangia bacterium]|nr:hypothetical protein [Polyangia bacterium]